jgi:hypothetical protein
MRGRLIGLLYSLVFWVALLLILTSCGANYHAQRAKHHINKAKEKGAMISVDTVYKEVDIIVPKREYITQVEYKTLHDTIRIENTEVKVKLRVDTVSKTVFVHAECKPDTVTVTVKVPCEQVKTGKSVWHFVGYGALLLLLGLVVGRLFWR